MIELKNFVIEVKEVLTPSGQPLQPAEIFSTNMIKRNRGAHLSECDYARQTGRTTAMVIDALQWAVNNSDNQHYNIRCHNERMRKHIQQLIEHYADQYGISAQKIKKIITSCGPIVGYNVCHTVYDNAITDVPFSGYSAYTDDVPDTLPDLIKYLYKHQMNLSHNERVAWKKLAKMVGVG